MVDVAAVEYITPDGRIQFARGNRNGLNPRYQHLTAKNMDDYRENGIPDEALR